MLIRRALFAALVVLAPLAATEVVQAPPAAASDTCYVKFYTDINYQQYVTEFPCPSYNSYNYWPSIGWPQAGAVSSMVVSMPQGWCATPLDSNNVGFGPLTGLDHWDIADLRPYGWNDRITGLIINTGAYC